jgi:2'-hydroxyisoflavone reductase
MIGPRDTSGRFLYWPVRASLGGVMVVPGALGDPIQLIDVRDVADWVIQCLEQNIVGVYNATGPATPLSMKEMVESVRTGAHSQVEFEWIDNHFLETHGVEAGQFPLYVAPEGDSAGFFHCDCSRALARGLIFRPLSETSRACLEWYRSLPVPTQGAVAPQFADHPNQKPWLQTEKHLLELWSQRAKK